MRRIIIAFTVLFLAGCVGTTRGVDFYDAKPEYADTITITSLPYNCATSDRVYVTDGDMTASDWAIRITASRVLLDMGEDSIGYNTAGGDYSIGLLIEYGVDSVWVEGGYLYMNQDTTTTADWCNTVQNRGEYTKFHDVNINVKGRDSKGYRVRENGPQALVACTLTSDVYAYTSRVNNDAALIHCYTEEQLPDSIPNLLVDSCHFENFPHVGIYFGAYKSIIPNTSCRITNNTFIGDGRNDYYSYPSGTMQSSENNYAIMILIAGDGSIVSNNTIQAGTNYEGVKGIMAQGMYGKPDNWCVISNNFLDTIHRGPSDQFVNGECVGFYIRPEPHTDMDRRTNNQYLRVDSNDIYIKVAADTTKSYIGTYAEGIRLHASDSTQYVKIRNNHVEVFRDPVVPDTAEINRFALAVARPDTNMDHHYEVKEIEISNNYWKGVSPVSAGSGRAYTYGFNQITLTGDTLHCAVNSNDSNSIVFNDLGTRIGHSTGSSCRGCVFLGYSEREVSHWDGWDHAPPSYVVDSCDDPDYGKTFTFQEYLRVLVMDADTNTVSSADFTVVNSYGDTITNNEAYLVGLYRKWVDVSFDAYGYWDECLLSDSNYQPFIVTAVVDGDTAVDTITLGLNPGVDSMFLPVAHEPEPDETTRYVPFWK